MLLPVASHVPPLSVSGPLPRLLPDVVTTRPALMVKPNLIAPEPAVFVRFQVPAPFLINPVAVLSAEPLLMV